MILRVVVFYGLMAFLLVFIGGVQQEVGLPDDLLFLFQWAPGIAGLLTMLIFRKRDSVRITFFDPEMPLQRYLWAFLLPLSHGLLAFVFALLVLGDPQGMSLTATGVLTMIIGAVGEEIGWRGYLHKRIAPHMSGLTSSLLVGVLWTLFHVQYYEGGLLFMVLMGMVYVSLTIMAYAALADYAFNVLGATVFHLAINLTAALVAGLVLSFRLPFVIAYSVIAALIAAAVVFQRRDLFFNKLAPAESAPRAAQEV
jgi:membrane protease YdiL (CAAX protease family)